MLKWRDVFIDLVKDSIMANFCPECGKATIQLDDGGQKRKACPDGHFIHLAETKIDIEILVVQGESALLIKRVTDTRPAGIWLWPYSRLAPEESLPDAVIRQVYEDTQMTVVPRGILLVSNRVHKGRNEIYIVFLCEADLQQKIWLDRTQANEAKFIAPAKFITPDEDYLYQTRTLTLHRYIIKEYLAHRLKPMAPIDMSKHQSGKFYAWESRSEE